MQYSGENVIEWITGSDTVTVTFTNKRFITKVRRLVEQGIGEIIAENEDGSVLAHLPISCIKIGKKREVSDEMKDLARERFNAVLGSKKRTWNRDSEEERSEDDE